MTQARPYGCPVLHLAGSSRDVLIDDRRGLLDALRIVQEKFKQMEIHPRDYISVRNSEYLEALRMRAEYVHKLEVMIETIQVELIWLLDQQVPGQA